MNIIEIILNALKLILSGDLLLFEIIFLSIRVSITALFISSTIGIIFGYIIAFKEFYFKNFVLIFLNSLMGIPPVVVGLIVYFIFANDGPLGVLKLLYTPAAMIIFGAIKVLSLLVLIFQLFFSLEISWTLSSR